MSKKNTTYVVHLTSTSKYGSNQDHYFRTEKEQRRFAAEAKEWFKNVPSQQITTSSHQWSND